MLLIPLPPPQFRSVYGAPLHPIAITVAETSQFAVLHLGFLAQPPKYVDCLDDVALRDRQLQPQVGLIAVQYQAFAPAPAQLIRPNAHLQVYVPQFLRYNEHTA